MGLSSINLSNRRPHFNLKGEGKKDLMSQNKPQKEEISKNEVQRLDALVISLIEPQNNYSKEDIMERIKQVTKVNQERAERGFNLFLQTGNIEPTLGDRYYLTGSTPF